MEKESILINKRSPPGIIWILVSTKYTVVARKAASLSNAVPGLMKCVTSAICTPTSRLPFGKSLQ